MDEIEFINQMFINQMLKWLTEETNQRMNELKEWW